MRGANRGSGWQVRPFPRRPPTTDTKSGAKIGDVDPASVFREKFVRGGGVRKFECFLPFYAVFERFDKADIGLPAGMKQEAVEVTRRAVLPALDSLGLEHAAERALLI